MTGELLTRMLIAEGSQVHPPTLLLLCLVVLVISLDGFLFSVELCWFQLGGEAHSSFGQYELRIECYSVHCKYQHLYHSLALSTKTRESRIRLKVLIIWPLSCAHSSGAPNNVWGDII